jgi:hypothetical protein
MAEVQLDLLQESAPEEHGPADGGEKRKSPPAEDIEREARSQGWVDESEFRGNPDHWMDAETYVKRAQELNPILKKNNEALNYRVSSLSSELAETKRTMAEFKAYHEGVEKRAYERALAELKSQKKEAVASGDGEKVVELDDRIAELRDRRPQEPEPPKVKSDPMQDPAFRGWIDANPWYMNSKAMAGAANQIAYDLRQERPDLGFADFLTEVTRRVREEFPEKFSNQRRSAPAAVEGAGAKVLDMAARRRERRFEDLPKEAQEACARFEKNGMCTREEYVKNYDWG